MRLRNNTITKTTLFLLMIVYYLIYLSYFHCKRTNMLIIKPSYLIEDDLLGLDLLKRIERYGRTCYKSEDKITNESALSFVKMIINNGHETVLEHEKITVRIICDRGISHEIV